MDEFPSFSWFEKYQKRVNADPEMQLIGRWFTDAFSVSCGNVRHVLRVKEGRLVEIVKPRIDVRSSFGIRAPEEIWQRFLEPKPKPLYHDIFAMIMRVPEFVLDGDTLAAMQNARALHRMLTLMREAA
jgi:hypothetical protein